MPWQISFRAWGERFSPSKIKYSFTSAYDFGSVGKSGKYKNQPMPFGSIVIEVPKKIPNSERIKYIVKIIQPLLPEIIRAGATNYYLDIARYYSSQCNESYSSEELALMAGLNCSLNYSAYQVSEIEENELVEKLGG